MSAPDIDPNKIAADLIHRIAKDAAKSVTSGLRDFFSKVLDLVRQDLSAYLAVTLEKCCHIKTPIINRDRPTPLFDIYVHTKIKVHSKVLDDDDFIPVMIGLKSVVIAGNAGSGKSMFMRYLFVSLCEKGYGKIPLFIELRNLNSFNVKDLVAFMYYSVVGPGGVITLDQFESGLKSGAFIVVLDGFDEVDFDQRENLEAQICKVSVWSNPFALQKWEGGRICIQRHVAARTCLVCNYGFVLRQIRPS